MSDEEQHRPMDPGFDPFPLDVPEGDPTPPILIGLLEGADGTDLCASPQEMAESFSAPVFMPSRWARGALVERRAVVRPGVPPSAQTRYYLATARCPGVAAPVLVHGYFGASPYRVGEGGCWAPTELSGLNGVVFEGPDSVNLSVERDGQCVLLLNYPSVDDVVTAASSMERFEPSAPA